MNYTFNCDIAKIAGVEGAVMIENLYYWITKNKANRKHFYDENYWTYNSIQAFEELFPFWTRRQIERILRNLEKEGFVVTGNYNKVAYDRTKWYGLTQTVKSIYANGEMEIPKQGNGNPQTVEPIPNINTDSNPNSKQDNIDIPYQEIIEYLNLKANTKYKASSKKTKDLVKARFNEGFELEDFKIVIDKKSTEWLGTKFENYLRPETLFSNKFEGYLNQRVVNKFGTDKQNIGNIGQEYEGIGFSIDDL